MYIPTLKTIPKTDTVSHLSITYLLILQQRIYFVSKKKNKEQSLKLFTVQYLSLNQTHPFISLIFENINNYLISQSCNYFNNINFKTKILTKNQLKVAGYTQGT